MKNPFIVFILAFCALFAACQPAKNEAQPSQIATTLIRGNHILYRNCILILNEIQSTAEVKNNIIPLYELAQKIKKKADAFQNSLDYAIKNNNNIPYNTLFEEYAAFCEAVKNDMIAIQQAKIMGVRISKEKLDTLFAHSPFIGKRQKQLSKAEFEQLKGVDLEVYLLILQQDLFTGLHEILVFLGDQFGHECFPNLMTYKILSSPQKPAIFLGEEYKAEIMIAPYYVQPINFDLYLNGDNLPIEESKAIYSIFPTKVGLQSYHVSAKYTDPITAEVQKVSQIFYYEVLPAKAKK